MTSINIGLDDNARTAVSEGLKKLLADTMAVYTKTHGFHWNVTGPHFQQLHTLFEDQYRETWNALDEIAERVRALGAFAPSNSAQMADLTTIAASEMTPPDAQSMVETLLRDNEALIVRARDALSLAEEAGDAASADLITVRIQAHEKAAWMLRATLG